MNETVYYKSKYDIKKELDAIAPEDDYRNGIIAKAITIGKKEKLNDDWVRCAVLTDYEDGFVDYDTALRLYHLYNDYLKKTFVKVR